MKSTHLTQEPFQLFALGLDAGGTSTRWALADRSGQGVAEGKAAALSGWMLTSADGQKQMSAALQDIAKQCQTLIHAEPATATGPLAALCFGLTGFDGDAAPQLAPLLTQAFGLPAARQRLFNDVELACRAVFAPGEGYLVYAGTGSVAAFVDEHEVQHRAGGRGGLIDDGGSGYWIAREALRHIWRAEDEAPGCWMQSAMAQRVFAKVGGSDWSASRSWVYGASRGQLGELAVAVADAADEDAAAMDILQRAGFELARLGLALVRRCGARPLALAGRVFDLHPAVQLAAQQGLAGFELLPRQVLQAHHTAAGLAARLAAQMAAQMDANVAVNTPGGA